MLNLLHSLAMWEIFTIFAEKNLMEKAIIRDLYSLFQYESDMERCFGDYIVSFYSQLRNFACLRLRQYECFEDIPKKELHLVYYKQTIPASFDIQAFNNLLDHYLFLPGKDRKIKAAIENAVLIYFYEETKNTTDTMNECEASDAELEQYQKFVRPDLLKLYLALHTPKNPKLEKPIQVRFYGDSLCTLDNKMDWIISVLEEYLREHLGIDSTEQALAELNALYGKKSGVQLQNHYLTLYMHGLYHLLEKSTLIKKKGQLPNRVVTFISQILSQIGLLIEDEDLSFEIMKVRIRQSITRYNTPNDILRYQNYQVPKNYDPDSTKQLF